MLSHKIAFDGGCCTQEVEFWFFANFDAADFRGRLVNYVVWCDFMAYASLSTFSANRAT